MRFAPLLLLLTAAAPSPYISMNYAATVPTPTITRNQPAPEPGSFQPAPIPNRDLSAPASVGSNQPSIAPTLFSTTPAFHGNGDSGDSSEQAAHDHRLSPSAGLNLSMPVNGW